jgi:hypothetical protein
VSSTLSIGSIGSFASIGSVGSAFSIGSVGSAFSIGSIWSFASIGSALSAASVFGVLAWRVVTRRAVRRAALRDGASPGRRIPAGVVSPLHRRMGS